MRLPPLNALKAFEAAARHGSFARAAEELHVSPGAISRHVKLLEEHFGVALFERLAQGLKPTDVARDLLPKITASFELIAQAAAGIASPKPELKVMCSPTLANRWLIPRLPHFAEAMPQITVSVSVFLSNVEEFMESGLDCAIATFYRPQWPDTLKVQRVKEEELTPFAAPALQHRLGPLSAPADLKSQTLLHIAACRYDWPNWLAANSCMDVVDYDKGPTFETGELAIRAAVEGLGVVLMDRFLLESEKHAGRLVDLFPTSTFVDNGYFFFCRRERWQEPGIAAFRRWLGVELDAHAT